MDVDLDEELIDHLASKPFANSRELLRRFLGARFAGESGFRTDPGITFF